jgi:hypothetical protein
VVGGILNGATAKQKLPTLRRIIGSYRFFANLIAGRPEAEFGKAILDLWI